MLVVVVERTRQRQCGDARAAYFGVLPVCERVIETIFSVSILDDFRESSTVKEQEESGQFDDVVRTKGSIF